MTAAEAEGAQDSPEAPQTTESPEEPETPEGEEDSDESEFDVEEYLKSEASDYEAFGTVEDLYKEAEEAATVDDNIEVVYESGSDIYITEESLENLETSFEDIDEELEEDTSSGILGRVKDYGNKIKGYLSDITPNDKWDWGLYGTGAAMGIGMAGTFPLFAITGALSGGVAGAWRSYKGTIDESDDEESDDYELGELEPYKDRNIKAISRESLDEIEEEYQGE